MDNYLWTKDGSLLKNFAFLTIHLWSSVNQVLRDGMRIVPDTGFIDMILELPGFKCNDRYHKNTNTKVSEGYCLLDSEKLKSLKKTLHSTDFLVLFLLSRFPQIHSSSSSIYFNRIAITKKYPEHNHMYVIM